MTDVEEESVIESGSRKLTMLEYITNFDNLLELLNDEIDKRSRRKGDSVRLLQRIRKHVSSLKTSAKWVTKGAKRAPPTVNGLDIPIIVSDELADFLQLDGNEDLTRIDVTRALCVYCHLSPDEEREETLRWKYLNEDGRDLRNPDNRQQIIPDKQLRELLGYDKYIDDVKNGKVIAHRKNKITGEREEYVVTDPALTYFRLQYLLSKHITTA